MDEVRDGEGLYEGTEPCVVRILRGTPTRGARRSYYIEWGRKVDDREFGTRLGPFATIRDAVAEAEAKTLGTVEWSR